MHRFNFRPAPLALAVALGLAAVGAHAQVAPTAQGAVGLSIAAQPLAQALNDLARQTRMELMVQPTLVAGRSAPAVAGTLTVNEALGRLLAGTGLVGAIEGSTILVRRPPPASQGETSLSEVRVQAQAERSALTEHTGSYTTSLAGTATPLGLSLRDQGASDAPTHSARVLLADGRVEPRAVQVAVKSRHLAEVRTGLQEGEQLVTGERPARSGPQRFKL